MTVGFRQDESMNDPLQSLMVRLLGKAIAYDGVGYRSSSPKYANEQDLLTGEGSRREGGRWNPKRVAAVYASLSPETALAETLAHARYYGLPVDDVMPRTFVAIEAKLQTVLDLRQRAIRRRLQVSADLILQVDWRNEMRQGREPITQAIGRAASQAGWEGLLVRSAADRAGSNLLVFPDNLRPGSEVRVRNPGRLRT